MSYIHLLLCDAYTDVYPVAAFASEAKVRLWAKFAERFHPETSPSGERYVRYYVKKMRLIW